MRQSGGSSPLSPPCLLFPLPYCHFSDISPRAACQSHHTLFSHVSIHRHAWPRYATDGKRELVCGCRLGTWAHAQHHSSSLSFIGHSHADESLRCRCDWRSAGVARSGSDNSPDIFVLGRAWAWPCVPWLVLCLELLS